MPKVMPILLNLVIPSDELITIIVDWLSWCQGLGAFVLTALMFFSGELNKL
jgi:hypothetical protein